MSLLLLPLATVFSLEFTTPAWTLLLAVPVLGERMTASRIGAVALGLLGVLVIVRPASRRFSRPRCWCSAAVCFAITLILTKKLTRTDSTFAIIFWMNLIQTPLALVRLRSVVRAKLERDQVPAALAVGISGWPRIIA